MKFFSFEHSGAYLIKDPYVQEKIQFIWKGSVYDYLKKCEILYCWKSVQVYKTKIQIFAQKIGGKEIELAKLLNVTYSFAKNFLQLKLKSGKQKFIDLETLKIIAETKEVASAFENQEFRKLASVELNLCDFSLEFKARFCALFVCVKRVGVKLPKVLKHLIAQFLF